MQLFPCFVLVHHIKFKECKIDNKMIHTSFSFPEIYPDTYMVRHLLEKEPDNFTYENCTKRGISSFPTLFTNEQRQNGAIIINFLVSFYMCGVIGYCCSAYFVPSLEVICQGKGTNQNIHKA